MLAEAGTPAAVVLPRRTEDVVAVLRVAARHGIPVVPRGAGSRLFYPPDPSSYDWCTIGGNLSQNSGEHGVGSLKVDWLEREIGPVSPAVHRSIKGALDPAGLLKPGQGVPDATRHDVDHRRLTCPWAAAGKHAAGY
jgi:FAD/FMN-containing dehydrogenase